MSEKSIKPIVEDNTPKVEETMQAYQTSPAVSLIDKAIADAHVLQEKGKIAAALEKWHSLANVVEEVDNEVANQLEKSNHPHLGKVLTYAAGLDAATIIWIAEKFRPEHRNVLNWLNKNTSTALQFLGVEIEGFQIADSPYAPTFTIVTDIDA